MSRFALLIHKEGKPLELSAAHHEPFDMRILEACGHLFPVPLSRQSVVIVAAERIPELRKQDQITQSIHCALIPHSIWIKDVEKLVREFGTITYTAQAGGVAVSLQRNNRLPKCAARNAWPLMGEDHGVFARKQRSKIEHPGTDGVFVSRWDESFDATLLHGASTVWAAGLTTWTKLARAGVWVTGCCEGLGFDEIAFAPRYLTASSWTIISHGDAPARNGIATLQLYDLEPTGEALKLEGKTHFYWKSGSLFLEALRQHSGIVNGWHACGPGATRDTVLRHVPPDRVAVFLNFDDWKMETVKYETSTTSALVETYPRTAE